MSKEEKEEFFKQNKSNYNNDEFIKIEKENTNILSKLFTLNDYEKIINKSYNFESSAFLEFVECLCYIAKKEFIDNGITKIFFLQKIVETAENNIFNNKKINININQIWKILSNFFVKVGILDNIENANTCIDSLRQLVSKFLQKNECKELNFQSELFKPFLQIINRCQNRFVARPAHLGRRPAAEEHRPLQPDDGFGPFRLGADGEGASFPRRGGEARLQPSRPACIAHIAAFAEPLSRLKRSIGLAQTIV